MKIRNVLDNYNCLDILDKDSITQKLDKNNDIFPGEDKACLQASLHDETIASKTKSVISLNEIDKNSCYSTV